MVTGQYIAVIFLGMVLYAILMTLLHGILEVFDIRDKMSIVIKLPKHKKYNGKVDPIYTMRPSDFSKYAIEKYALSYEEPEWWVTLNIALIPYPIKILKYGYHFVDVHSYDGDENTITKETRSLKEIYEEKERRAQKWWSDEQAKDLQESAAIAKLNKEFDENYE